MSDVEALIAKYKADYLYCEEMNGQIALDYAGKFASALEGLLVPATDDERQRSIAAIRTAQSQLITDGHRDYAEALNPVAAGFRVAPEPVYEYEEISDNKLRDIARGGSTYSTYSGGVGALRAVYDYARSERGRNE